MSAKVLSGVLVVLITIYSEEAAKGLAHGLVKHSHSACVNILPQVTSVYMWEGKVHEDREVMLVAKTTEERLAGLIEFVKGNHPYEVPEILAVETRSGLPAYLEYVAETLSYREKDGL